jgi:hypothetical protein
LFSIPAILVGAGLGLAARDPASPQGRRAMALAVLLTVGGSLVNLAAGKPGAAVSYATAGICVPAALCLPFPDSRWLRSFAGLSMGVYASHPFMLLVLRRLAGNQLPPLPVTVGCVLLGSLVFAALLRTTRWGRLIV